VVRHEAARGEKMTRSMPRCFIRASWLRSIDSRSSSSVIVKSERAGISEGSLMPAI
jgi:hypothetical protein